MSEFLIKTMYLYPKYDKKSKTETPDRMIIVSEDTETHEYKIRDLKEPTFSFYKSKDDKIDENFVFGKAISDCVPITCKYKDLYKVIAEITGEKEFYQLSVSNGAKRNVSLLQRNKMIHGSDENIEDYYIRLFYNKYPLDLINNKFKVGFYDIEVDSFNIDGFPDEREAQCPVSSISFILDDVFHLYLLDFSNSPHRKEYPKLSIYDDLKDKKKKKEIKNILFNYVKEKEQLISKNIGTEIDLIHKFELKLFEDEETLIRSFYNKVNEYKPYLMAAWNASFDFITLLNRISILNKEPLEAENSDNKTIFRFSEVARQAIVPEEFLEKGIDTVQYLYDTSSHLIEERTHVCKIASFSNWIDQEQIYAFRRKTRKQDSWSLDRTAEIVLKDKKHEKPKGTTIKNILYAEPLEFFKYSTNDTLLQACIEDVTKDLYIYWNITQSANTRFDRATKKSTILCNLLRGYMIKNGYILSNNHSFLFKNDKFKVKIKGAFCGDPNLIEENGEILFKDLGKKSSKIFHNVIDEDLAAIYPSTEISFNISMDKMIGKIRFTNEEEIYNVDEEVISFMDDLLSSDEIGFGNKYFNLPDEKELILGFK